MVPPPRGGLAFEMVVEFGVENTLGKRLLQLVEKPVLERRVAGERGGNSESRRETAASRCALRTVGASPRLESPLDGTANRQELRQAGVTIL